MKGAGKKEPPAMAAASPRRARSPVRGPCPSRCGRTGAAGSRASPARLRARATPPGRRRLTTSTGVDRRVHSRSHSPLVPGRGHLALG